MQKIPLIADLKSDKALTTNFVKVCIFIGVVFIFDYLLSLLILKGIERNYGIGSDADILVVGHSHIMLALDKNFIEKSTGFKVAKYTREGANIADREIMIKHYISQCTKKPKIVVLSVDPWLFTGEGLSLNSYTRFYPFMDVPSVNLYVKASSPTKFDYYYHKLFRCTRFDVVLINSSLRGYMNNWSNLKFGIVDTAKLQKELVTKTYRKIRFATENIATLYKVLNFLQAQDIKVILLNTPVYKPLVAIQQSAYDKSMRLIANISDQYNNSAFVDLSPPYTDHTSYFYDPIHMNPGGQKELTKAFLERLTKMTAFSCKNH